MKKMMILVLLLSSTLVALATPAEFGEASFYSDKFHGKPTASGELYDYNKLTAAHKTLPFGTLIKVTRTDNNKSITVRVNDRGPYIAGRIVDLSRAAAQAIGLLETGKANVKVEVVKRPDSNESDRPAADQPIVDIKPTVPETYNEPDPAIVTRPRAQKVTPPPAPKPATPVKKPSPPTTTTSKGSTSVAKPTSSPAPTAAKTEPKSKSTIPGSYKDFGLYEVQIRKPESRGFAVQVALLSNYENALQTIVDLQNKWFDNVLLSIEPDREGVPQYKVVLGPFPDRATANGYKEALKKNKGMNGFVVDLERARY